MTFIKTLVLLIGVLHAPTVYAFDSCQALFRAGVDHQVIRLPHVVSRPAERTLVRYENQRDVVVMHYAERPTLESVEHEKTRVLKYGGEIVAAHDRFARENDPSVNCHAYACLVHDIPGLPDGWIEPIAHETTNDVDSLATLLDTFFARVSDFRAESLSPDLVPANFTLRDGDLVTFLDEKMNIHSGIAIFKTTSEGQRVWIRSKLGQTITADLPPEIMHLWYDFTRVEIWRRK